MTASHPELLTARGPVIRSTKDEPLFPTSVEHVPGTTDVVVEPESGRPLPPTGERAKR